VVLETGDGGPGNVIPGVVGVEKRFDYCWVSARTLGNRFVLIWTDEGGILMRFVGRCDGCVAERICREDGTPASGRCAYRA